MLTRGLYKCMGTLIQPKHDQVDEIHRDKMLITNVKMKRKKKQFYFQVSVKDFNTFTPYKTQTL